MLMTYEVTRYLELEDVSMMSNVMVECEAGQALSSHLAGPVAQLVRAADS